MPLALPRFCAILDPSVRPQLTLDEIARLLTAAGVRLVQLRAKQATSHDLFWQTCGLLSSLPSETWLVVNDRADVAALAGAAGVHVGQEDLPAAAARELLGAEKIVGLSTHTVPQARAAAASPVDYLAVGPIFATATKKDARAAVGLDHLKSVRTLTDKPIVAIGGITPQNASAVLEAGADSVAVITGWLAADDIPTRLEEFRHALGRLD